MHFCDKIEYGTVVTVTDMTGTQFTYTVSDVHRARHAETQWLMADDCDLTLFCHDGYSMEYIAVDVRLPIHKETFRISAEVSFYMPDRLRWRVPGVFCVDKQSAFSI